MKIKNILLSVVLLQLFSISIGCTKWTEVEKEDFFVNTKTENYYKHLRAYKKSDHAISFGWHAQWNCTGPIGFNYLMGLPDSLDIVSMWGGANAGDNPAKLKDMQDVRKIKGTRLVSVNILHGIDKEEYDWSEEDNGEAAVRKYARKIVANLDEAGLDGFDLDYEPNYGAHGNIVDSKERTVWFVDELSKYLGPQSGTGKLLIIDGEPQSIPPSTGPMFDYFVVQAYSCHSDSDLDRRLQRTINNFNGVLTPEEVTRKYVVTENFEDGIDQDYTDRNGKKYKYTLEGMSRWQPKTGVRKGGIGSYKMSADYNDVSTPWYLYRNAIQLMNPAVTE